MVRLRGWPHSRHVMKNNSTTAYFVQTQTHGLPICSQVIPAQVVTRWQDGCHIRVSEAHDAILPANALPGDTDHFAIRILQGGVEVHVAA